MLVVIIITISIKTCKLKGMQTAGLHSWLQSFPWDFLASLCVEPNRNLELSRLRKEKLNSKRLTFNLVSTFLGSFSKSVFI